MKEKIFGLIDNYINDYCIKKGFERMWKKPIIKYADANAPEIKALKQIVGENHFLPSDFLQNPKNVLVYFLPFKEDIAKSNIKEEKASELWARAYLITNETAAELNEYLVKEIKNLGYNGAVPANIGFKPDVLKSPWSQRHLGWIAGHGTFGMNNMLISDEGCCGRYFSIITDLPVTTDTIQTEERCAYKIDKTCGVCMKKCFSGALTKEGFNRYMCFEVCKENEKIYTGAQVCGKCVTGLPCSHKSSK